MPICSIWGSHFCRFLLCQNLIIFISQVFSTYLLYLFILFIFIEVAPWQPWKSPDSSAHAHHTQSQPNPHHTGISCWNFFHSTTIPKGCLRCPEKRTSSRNYNWFFGSLFFSQNGMTLKKPTKIRKVHWKVTGFWDIIKVCSILPGKEQPKPIKANFP